MTRRDRQRAFWAQPRPRAEMDQRRPEVGDRVFCSGLPYVIEYINADGTLGLAYDGRAHPPSAQQNGERR